MSDNLFQDIGNWFNENPLISSIASTAVTGYALYKVQESIRSDQATTTTSTPPTSSLTPTNSGSNTTTAPAADPGVTIQIPPNQDNRIPVIYGRATCAGTIIEAVQSEDNKKMTYVLAISEVTGNLMSSNFLTPSHYHFNSMRWAGSRVVFQADGVTANYITDRDGNLNRMVKDMIKIRCYAGGSASTYQIAPEGFTITPSNAYDNVPTWTSAKAMTDLVFAVVEVTYNKEKGLTDLPNMNFTITNSLNQPGDVLCDYMTNTRYGAGIPIEDILVS
jgi:hypothetical protein